MVEQENIKAWEYARIALYLGVGALGLVALALGIIQREWELVTLGSAIMGACGIATWNVPTVNSSIKGQGQGRGKHGA